MRFLDATSDGHDCISQAGDPDVLKRLINLLETGQGGGKNIVFLKNRSALLLDLEVAFVCFEL